MPLVKHTGKGRTASWDGRLRSAFAIAGASQCGRALFVSLRASSSQPSCQTGAVRAIAVATPGVEGLDNLPATYTSDGSYFSYCWSCTGGQISIRKPRAFLLCPFEIVLM